MDKSNGYRPLPLSSPLFSGKEKRTNILDDKIRKQPGYSLSSFVDASSDSSKLVWSLIKAFSKGSGLRLPFLHQILGQKNIYAGGFPVHNCAQWKVLYSIESNNWAGSDRLISSLISPLCLRLSFPGCANFRDRETLIPRKCSVTRGSASCFHRISFSTSVIFFFFRNGGASRFLGYVQSFLRFSTRLPPFDSFARVTVK